MHIELDRSGSAQELAGILEATAGRDDVKGIVVLSCDGNGFTPEKIDPILKNCPVPLAGGIFPSIIHNQDILDHGSIVIGLAQKPELSIVRDMSAPQTDFLHLITEMFQKEEVAETILIFTDGFSSRISSFINAIFINLGLERNIIGGGAGSLSLEQRPCVISNEGLLQDASVIIQLDTGSSVNISHGWYPIKGPFKVTEADRNIIKSINWMPAFNIYREAIREHSGLYLTPDNFSSIAMAYPFGISRMSSDPIVRDAVMVDDSGALTCVGEISEGSFINILHGNQESLIKASAELYTGNNKLNLGADSAALMIDCISRALFLKEQFKQELEAVHIPDIPLLGFLSFGEIATLANISLEFHNKTTVLSILEEL